MNVNQKKHYLILGGFTGFLLTFILGALNQKEPLLNMLHATIGCIVGTILTRILLFVIYLHENTDDGVQTKDDNKDS